MVQTVRRTIAIPQLPLFVQFLDKFLSPVVVQRQVLELVQTVCSSWTRLVTCPLWALMVQTVLQLVVIPQVQFLDKVMVMGPLWAFMAQTVLKPVNIPQEQFLDKVMASWMWCRGPDGAGHHLEVPQLQFIFEAVNIPVMTQR